MKTRLAQETKLMRMFQYRVPPRGGVPADCGRSRRLQSTTRRATGWSRAGRGPDPDSGRARQDVRHRRWLPRLPHPQEVWSDDGREIQSMAFFNTPGMEWLYSGDRRHLVIVTQILAPLPQPVARSPYVARLAALRHASC